MDKNFQEVRDELNADIKCLQQQIDEVNPQLENSKELNLCIVNHPESSNENVEQIVSDLISDGLKLQIGFRKAVRKTRQDNKPGVIIVTCNSAEDRETILNSKTELKNCLKYQTVYVNPDRSVE